MRQTEARRDPADGDGESGSGVREARERERLRATPNKECGKCTTTFFTGKSEVDVDATPISSEGGRFSEQPRNWVGEVALKIRVKSCRTMRLRLTGNAPSCYVPIVVPALLVLAASHSLCHAWEPLPFLPRPQAATAILPVALTALMVVASQPRSVSLRGTSYNNLTRPSDIFPIPGGSLFCLCHAMQCPSPSLPLSDPLFPPPPLLSLSLSLSTVAKAKRIAHHPTLRPSVRPDVRSVGRLLPSGRV